MITYTSLLNPKFLKRLRRSLWLAKLQSMKTGKRSTEYVVNRKGNNVLRIDMLATGEMLCYIAGRGMQNYSAMIIKALEK
jgi:hypothetical protein